MRGLQGTTGVLAHFPLNQLRKTTLQIGDESLCVFIDARATLSVINPPALKQPVPQSTKTVQIVGISDEPRQVPVSEPLPYCLGPLRDAHPFLLNSSTPIHLLGPDVLENYHARLSFSQKGKTILELTVAIKRANQMN